MFTPASVLVALHTVDPTKDNIADGTNRMIAAISVCIQQRDVFNADALAFTLNQLINRCAVVSTMKAEGGYSQQKAREIHGFHAFRPGGFFFPLRMQRGAQDSVAAPLHEVRPADAGSSAPPAVLRAGAAGDAGSEAALEKPPAVEGLASLRRADGPRLISRPAQGELPPDILACSALAAVVLVRSHAMTEFWGGGGHVQLPPKTLEDSLPLMKGGIAFVEQLAAFAVSPRCPFRPQEETIAALNSVRQRLHPH